MKQPIHNCAAGTRRHGFRRALPIMALLGLASGVAQSQDTSLDQLVQELLQKNPAVLAARRSVDAKRAMVTPARTLPDPSVTFQTMGNLVPPTLMAGDPSSARVLRFTQELPFPGKLNLRGQIAATEADAEMFRYEQVRREAVAELKMAYYDLYLAQKLTELLEKSRDLLRQFADISQARYQVGQTAQQDVFKSQVELSRLLDRLAVLRQEQETARVRINTLLYRPPESPIGHLKALEKPEFKRTLDELYQLALARNPEVQSKRKDIDRDQLGVSLAKKSFYPDFEAGFAFYNRRDMPQMYELMFKATIPLYFWRRQRPELEAATAELISQRHEYEGTLSSLYQQLKDPYLKTDTDAELLDLYGNAIIPQANLALESSLSSYRVGTVDFLTLLNNQSTVLEYEMKYNEVLVDFYKALAALEAITGEVLDK